MKILKSQQNATDLISPSTRTQIIRATYCLIVKFVISFSSQFNLMLIDNGLSVIIIISNNLK